MNMKTTMTGRDKDRHEDGDVEVKIKICQLTISKEIRILNKPDLTEETYARARSNIEKEEKNLRDLKDKYPEYFI